MCSSPFHRGLGANLASALTAHMFSPPLILYRTCTIVVTIPQIGVTSIMIARGAEANPSCFRALPLSSLPVALSNTLPSLDSPAPSTTNSGTSTPIPTSKDEASALLLEPHLADPITEVIPSLLRLSLATNNAFGNTKYIINSMNLALTPPPASGSKARTKEERNGFKAGMNKAKEFEAAGAVFGLGKDEVEKAKEIKLEELVPTWEERRKVIEGDQKESDDQAGEVKLGKQAASA